MPSAAIPDTRLGHKRRPEPVEGLIPQELRPTIGEFIAEIGQILSLLCVILYGSAVRDELHDESDIDVFLLFDTDHKPELGEESATVARICVEVATRTDSYYDFSFVMSNLAQLETMDQDYLQHVVDEGIVIWSRPQLVLPFSAFPNQSQTRRT
jgi:predicted nucleotidyltransferase